MGLRFNPFTGNFDFTGGGGGGASYIDGEVAAYNDLPLDGTAALNSAWLVRTASGVWPVSRKQAGIYIRTATAGSSRDADYTYAGTMPDVFSDAQFLIYDDGNTTRTMQVELTDNETLTFKVTGTDSVVRSVAFALSAIVLAALMASSALAQNIGVVTDTNGNIVTRRTNELVWSNNLRFTPLTNANSRTAIIGTNGALSAGSVPSGAAANGALLTADGAGSSSFVASRAEVRTIATNSTKTSWTNLAYTDVANVESQFGTWTFSENSIYRIEWSLHFEGATNVGYAANSAGFRGLTFPDNSSGAWRGFSIVQNSSLSSVNNGTNDFMHLAFFANNVAQSNVVVTGTILASTGTNSSSFTFRWNPTINVTNPMTLRAGSMIRVEKLSP